MNISKNLSSLFLLVVALWIFTVNAAATEKNSDTETRIELRPGDTLLLHLEGEEDFKTAIEVDRQGTIDVPEIGKVSVSGQGLSEVQASLKQQLGQKFRIADSFTVTIVERKVPITVFGFVEKPGQFTLPENGNVQMALDMAGNPTAGAQLDRMHVRRGDQKIPFNYKAYLDSGDIEGLPKLQPLDMIFVPASPLIGNVQMDFDAATLVDGGDASDDYKAIKVFGEVNNPGLFSFKPGYSVVDMLMRAGGVTRYAGVEDIRVIQNGEPELFNLTAYLDSGDVSLMPEISEGSTLYIPIQEEKIKRGARTVYVMGEVFKPGAYELPEGAGFLDVLANSGGPTRFAESRQVRVLKVDGSVRDFDLQAYTEGLAQAKVPTIEPGDALFVPEKTDMNEKSWLKITPDRAVKVIGAVKKTGRFEWSDEMTFLDLLAHAGGPTSDADMSQIKILKDEAPNDPILFDLEAFIETGGSFDALPQINAQDVVVVPEKPRDVIDNKARWLRQSQESSIYVFGAVGQPGRYAFDNELSFLDILSAADGPTKDADIHNIHITHRQGNQAHVTKVNLVTYFETGDETLLPRVQTGDSIYIPEKERQWLDEKPLDTVRVLGAVERPGRYRFNEQMTILDLLAEAGGTNATAYLSRITVVNFSRATHGKDKSSVFDLQAFVKEPDFSQLPLVRAGDTVFVPDLSQSNWSIFVEGVKDVVSLFSVVSILGGI